MTQLFSLLLLTISYLLETLECARAYLCIFLNGFYWIGEVAIEWYIYVTTPLEVYDVFPYYFWSLLDTESYIDSTLEDY